MNESDRYAVSLENMEVLRAQVEALEAWKAEELALMNPLMDYARSVCTGPLGCSITEWLVEDHKEQAREIAVLKANVVTDNSVVLVNALAELERLKVQPGACVDELRKVVTEALMGMIAAVTSSTPPPNEPPPPFIQSAIDRAVDRIARLNQPASAGDENSEEGLEEWAKGKFGIGGRYTGKLYGNTDWALARVVWSAALARAALSANHSEQVRHMVPQMVDFSPVPDDFRSQANGYRAGWNDCRAMLAAAPSAGSQKEQGE